MIRRKMMHINIEKVIEHGATDSRFFMMLNGKIGVGDPKTDTVTYASHWWTALWYWMLYFFTCPAWEKPIKRYEVK